MSEIDYNVACSCAELYASKAARFLLGETFHPGGLELTRHLGEVLYLRSGQQVLDLASGTGAGAVYLAETFGCSVIGIDPGPEQVKEGVERVRKSRLDSKQVDFQQGIAESLPFKESQFDAVLTECALSTFADQERALEETRKVIRPGGMFGMTDMAIEGSLPEILDSELGQWLCISGSHSRDKYRELLEKTGFRIEIVEDQTGVLTKLLKSIGMKIKGAQFLSKVGVLTLPDLDWKKADEVLQKTERTIEDGILQYVLITAVRE
jgi:ubiquinone/menaquinone biosynthesis C-methylase UbiE